MHPIPTTHAPFLWALGQALGYTVRRLPVPRCCVVYRYNGQVVGFEIGNLARGCVGDADGRAAEGRDVDGAVEAVGSVERAFGLGRISRCAAWSRNVDVDASRSVSLGSDR